MSEREEVDLRMYSTALLDCSSPKWEKTGEGQVLVTNNAIFAATAADSVNGEVWRSLIDGVHFLLMPGFTEADGKRLLDEVERRAYKGDVVIIEEDE